MRIILLALVKRTRGQRSYASHGLWQVGDNARLPHTAMRQCRPWREFSDNTISDTV